MAAPVWKIDNDGTPLYLTGAVFSDSFEGGVDRWTTSGTASSITAASYSTWASVGAKSAKLDATYGASEYARIGTPLLPVLPGESYTATADANVITTRTGAIVYVQIDWYTSASAYISSSNGTGQTGTGTKSLTVTGTAPATAAYAKVLLANSASSTTGTMSVAFDNAVVVNNSTAYFLTGQQVPLPDVDPQYASSVTSEGDRLQTLRYRNRKVTLSLRVIGSSTSNLQTVVNDLQAKVGKINRDAVLGGTGYGGTLEFTTVNGTVVTFDVCSATMTSDLGRPYVVRDGTEVTLEFECAPFARGAEVDLGDNTGTAPMLVFTDTGVTGDVPGLGRLVVDNDSTADAASFIWGQRCYNYSSAATAALTWQAEALTPMNAGAAAAAGPTGASGSGNNTIYANNLTTAYQSILKSTVSTTYWTHVGAYRVYARVYGSGSGTVSVRGSWSLADIVNFTANTGKPLPANSAWCLMDLGVVRIPSSQTRWEFRVEAKSTTNGDDVYVDLIALVPVDEGFGVASAKSSTPASTLSAQDTFDQTSLVSGTTALSPLGGTWTTAGATGDFSMETSLKRLKRVTDKDTATTGTIKDGRFIVESTSGGPPAYTAQRAAVDFYVDPNSNTSQTVTGGLLLRYSSTTAFLAVTLSYWVGPVFAITMVNGTSVTTLASYAFSSFAAGGGEPLGTITAQVSANGVVKATLSGANNPSVSLSAASSVLATGGALASGKYGIVDWNQVTKTAGTAPSRTYDNFYGWQIATDAAAFASRSLTLDHKSVTRQDSAGAVSTRPASYSGDYLLVPPAGKEARTNQLAVRLGRGLVDGSGDDGTSDALSARLYVTPRYLQLPS